MEPTKEQKEKWSKEVEWVVELNRAVLQKARLIVDAETEGEAKAQAQLVALPESLWNNFSATDPTINSVTKHESKAEEKS